MFADVAANQNLHDLAQVQTFCKQAVNG